MHRDMTEDELRRFEHEELHRTDDDQPDGERNSKSEPVGSEQRRPPSGDPEVPPLNSD